MMKCLTFWVFLSLIMLNDSVQGRPQEIGEAAVLAFAQVKDSFDNGAAASDKKEFEFFGAKAKNDMQIGFGDAVRSKRSYQSALSQFNENSHVRRTIRSTNFLEFAKQSINSENNLRAKRETDDGSSEGGSDSDYDSEYDSEYDSDYSSSESEEEE